MAVTVKSAKEIELMREAGRRLEIGRLCGEP